MEEIEKDLKEEFKRLNNINDDLQKGLPKENITAFASALEYIEHIQKNILTMCEIVKTLKQL